MSEIVYLLISIWVDNMVMETALNQTFDKHTTIGLFVSFFFFLYCLGVIKNIKYQFHELPLQIDHLWNTWAMSSCPLYCLQSILIETDNQILAQPFLLCFVFLWNIYILFFSTKFYHNFPRKFTVNFAKCLILFCCSLILCKSREYLVSLFTHWKCKFSWLLPNAIHQNHSNLLHLPLIHDFLTKFTVNRICTQYIMQPTN